MEKCQIYKSKCKIGNGVYEYFFAEDFYSSLNSEGSCEDGLLIALIGVDIGTLELSRISDRYVVTQEVFNDLFKEKPFMTLNEIKAKEKELEMKSLDNFPM